MAKKAKTTPAKKAANKTKATAASVDDYLDAIASDAQRADCRALATLLRKTTNEPPRMWGPSIVGFGSYHYRYESGREGDACLTGFSARGKEIVVYLMPGAKNEDALLAKLGRHRRGKACLYFKRFTDIDAPVLTQLVANSVAHVRVANHRRAGRTRRRPRTGEGRWACESSIRLRPDKLEGLRGTASATIADHEAPLPARWCRRRPGGAARQPVVVLHVVSAAGAGAES